jgi:Fe2+ or Zn2+ uptake regulation protein
MTDLITQATDLLRASGGRMTAQRRIILDALTELAEHPTADEVYALAQARDRRLNPSTVYRTLAWLENAGLVSHCHLDAGPDGERSERYDPVTPTEHHHFICTRCGQVIEFAAAQIETIKAEFARSYDAAVEKAALTLYGLCAECQGAQLATGDWQHGNI